MRAGRARRATLLVALAVAMGVALASAAAVASTGGGHGGPPEPINWVYGLLGTDGTLTEPTLWFRLPEMPPPLLATLLNSAILLGGLYFAARKPIRHAIQQRRAGILAGIDAAQKMKQEAERELAGYEARLAEIESEIERIKTEMREAAEFERQQVLREARERARRMERDAGHLIEQEMKAVRESLLRDTARTAFASAEEALKRHLSAADHQRLADEYANALGAAVLKLGAAPGGRA